MGREGKRRWSKRDFLVRQLDKICIKKKLWLLQIFCVLVPLLITDTIIIGILIDADRQAKQQEMYNIADSVKYTLSSYFESSITLLNKIYMNENVNEFLGREFATPLEYYSDYKEYIENTLYVINTESSSVVIYADNPGIINGGHCRKLADVEGTIWYQKLMAGSREQLFFSDTAREDLRTKRNISLVKKLDYYSDTSGKALIKLDIDYSQLLRSISNANYSNTIYVCDGGTILFSNDGKGGLYAPFEKMPRQVVENSGVHTTMKICGDEWDIYVMPVANTVMDTMAENWLLLLGLILASVILPFGLMDLINVSFTNRITTLHEALEKALENKEDDGIDKLTDVRGTDEISMLMNSYNRMAGRMNDLIQNEYKNRIRRQESNIAKQKAELLALHSQINPHFLFNALESIRMHSVLKQEYETATMVEKLALMQRQYVEWGNDRVSVKDEMRFVEAYLELQKYRFGEKLKYEIEIEEGFEECKIPKLTLVTFVENACVHGVETKTSTVWVFVRVYQKGEELIFEVEDTGGGMPERISEQIIGGMREASIEMLRHKRNVGMWNAALRLKLYSQDRVRFELESEIGTGTIVTVAVAMEAIAENGAARGRTIEMTE